MAPQTTVISQYPLSRVYQERLLDLFGLEPALVTLGMLRESGMAAMLQRLRNIRGRVAIGLEDPTSVGALPILKMLASATRADEIMVLDHALGQTYVSRLAQGPELARFVAASLDGKAAVRKAARDLARLKAEPRVAARPAAGADTIAYINTNLWFGQKAGGSVGHISGVANGFLDHGLALDYYSVGGRLLIREEARLFDLVPPAVFGLPFEGNYFRFDRQFEAQVAPRIDPARVRFFYQRLTVGNFGGVRLSRGRNIPLVVEYNGSEVWVAKNWGRGMRYADVAEAAEDATLKHAHLVVTISDVLRDELLARGVAPERIVTYPNCVDADVYDPARFSLADTEALRAREGLAPDDVVATFLGTFGAWHGAEVLAEAIARLAASDAARLQQLRLKFLFIGDGLRLPRVREILDTPACRPFVHFAGLVPQQEAPLWLAASDILVSPHVANADGSRFFGSPTKLFEYMAMGKAIVASDLEQVGAVLRHSLAAIGDASAKAVAANGELALLVPPGVAEALAQGLVGLAADPALRVALGANARAEAVAHYTWKQHVAAILDGFQAVAG